MDTRINIRIFDKDINFLGEVDEYTSLFYIRKWNTYSEFEFHVSNMDKELFKQGNIIMLNNDAYRTGIIEYIEDNEDESKDIIIKGLGLLNILSNRITVPPVGYAYHSFNTNIESIIKGLINSNAIDPVDSARKIPLLENSLNNNKGDKLNFQTRYNNLCDELTKLSNHSGLGLSIKLDYKNKKYIFEVLEGKDRTYSQNINPPSIFSKKYDNITKRNYVESNISYKNVGYVAGQGEGANREFVIVNNQLKGLDRKELFIDARDISEGESLSLEDRGKIKLSENDKIKSFECEVNTKDYRKSWNLGDIVTVKDDELNIIEDYRITEVKEIYEVNGFKVETVFGSSLPTLVEKIKQSNDKPLAENSVGATGETGPQGPQGYSLNYNWNGTSLGIKREDEGSYKYTNLIGPQGVAGPKGDQGIQGPVGPQGPKGATGAIGPQGPQGEKGDTGNQGPKGDNGITPTIGTNGNWYLGSNDTGKPSRGIQGPKGDKGDQGIQGVPGPVGSTQSYIVFHQHFIATEGQTLFEWNDGYVYPTGVNAIAVYLNGVRLSNRIINELKGNVIQFKVGLKEGDKVFIEAFQMVVDLQGPKGDKGSTGERGPQGIQGPVGPQGPKGATGAIGPQGPQGEKGDTGNQGPKGDNGITPTIGTNGNWYLGSNDTGKPSRGVQGPKGDKGEQGIQGTAGPQGLKGDTGNQGPKGDNGITPTIGTNGNWYLGSNDTGKPSRGVQGPKGDKGDQGIQGATGPQGPKGDTGAQGPKGATGATGPQGTPGKDGTQIITSTSRPSGQTAGRVWIQLI